MYPEALDVSEGQAICLALFVKDHQRPVLDHVADGLWPNVVAAQHGRIGGYEP
jgi:hypothetical protein